MIDRMNAGTSIRFLKRISLVVESGHHREDPREAFSYGNFDWAALQRVARGLAQVS